MMQLKGCTQYASKSGKLSSGHRTGKGQFSFQSQRRAVPKNVQTAGYISVTGVKKHLWTDVHTISLVWKNLWTRYPEVNWWVSSLQESQVTELKSQYLKDCIQWGTFPFPVYLFLIGGYCFTASFFCYCFEEREWWRFSNFEWWTTCLVTQNNKYLTQL